MQYAEVETMRCIESIHVTDLLTSQAYRKLLACKLGNLLPWSGPVPQREVFRAICHWIHLVPAMKQHSSTLVQAVLWCTGNAQ